MTGILPLILICGGMLLVLALVAFVSNQASLNIKSKTVGDGQHGTARWAIFEFSQSLQVGVLGDKPHKPLGIMRL